MIAATTTNHLPHLAPIQGSQRHSLALVLVALLLFLSGSARLATLPSAAATLHYSIEPTPLSLVMAMKDASQHFTTLNLAPSPPLIPNQLGQVILVSLAQQWLWVFQDRHLVYAAPVTTGRPELGTPTGMYVIQSKIANTTFYSPWPPSSPYYYTPEHVNYAFFFRGVGFYLHDAPWRHDFGPGSNLPHTLPDGTSETGSHGCVNLPYDTAAWLYHWIAIGATLDIVS